MMRPFVLRRIKIEVEHKLPPKLETMIKCPLSEMQRFWIKRLLLKDSHLLAKLETDNSTDDVSGSISSSSSKKKSSGSGEDWKRLQNLLAQVFITILYFILKYICIYFVLLQFILLKIISNVIVYIYSVYIYIYRLIIIVII